MGTYALDVIFSVFRCAVGVVPDHLRLALDLAIGTFWTTSDIAHVSLLTWTDSPIVVEGWYSTFGMKATDLQFAELHVKVGDKVFKDISAL